MGEALYPWPVRVWFCDYCNRPVGVGEKPLAHCGTDSMSSTEAAPGFHWEDLRRRAEWFDGESQ